MTCDNGIFFTPFFFESLSSNVYSQLSSGVQFPLFIYSFIYSFFFFLYVLPEQPFMRAVGALAGLG